MKVVLAVVLVVAAAVQEGAAMTVSQKEADALPKELRPIVRGGSWFDDMALVRLRKMHQDLRNLGEQLTHDHEDHPEEQFIMARLRNPDMTYVEVDLKAQEEEERKEGEQEQQEQPQVVVQSTREAMRNFLRHHTYQREFEGEEDLEDDQSKVSVTTSSEFMDKYEKELEGFFRNFMSAMLQAEIGGVSIENHSEEEEEEDRTLPSNTSEDRTLPSDTSEDRTLPSNTSEDRTLPSDTLGDRTLPDDTSGGSN
nr:uncharacterized protein LOC123752951 [Procambarus clarkii]